MHKKWSLYLGKLAGIKIYIHWTFFILLIWIFLMHFRGGQGLSPAISGTLFVLALFACVVFHEFGHSLTARRFKISTRDITVYPIGGISSLESMPSKPLQEFQVAVAGPAVNVAIALIIFIYLKATGQPVPGLIGHPIDLSGKAFLPNLMYANIILVLFNILPAFPMDGGRLLRSLLALWMTHSKATTIAARTGQMLAIVFVFFGFFADFWLVFIGLFVFLGAEAEYKTEELKDSLTGVRAGDVMITGYTILNPSTTINEASRNLVSSNEKSFVVVDNEQVVGVVTYKNIVDAMNSGNSGESVSNFMQRDIQSFDRDELISDKFLILLNHSHALFPVLENGKLAGVITPDNLFKWIQMKRSAG